MEVNLSSPTFWHCVDTFHRWEDIVGKKVSKLPNLRRSGISFSCTNFSLAGLQAFNRRATVFVQCCGSGMFISDPGSWFLSISDPGSNNSTKRGGGKFFGPSMFCSHKYHKIVNNFNFEQVKKFFRQNTTNHGTFYPQTVNKLSKIWVWEKPIPDPG